MMFSSRCVVASNGSSGGVPALNLSDLDSSAGSTSSNTGSARKGESVRGNVSMQCGSITFGTGINHRGINSIRVYIVDFN